MDQPIEQYQDLNLSLSNNDDIAEEILQEKPNFSLKSTLFGHKTVIMTVKFSSDASMLASGSLDSIIKIWDIHTGIALKSFIGHNLGIMDLSWSHNGLLLASASMDKTLRIWDVLSGKCLKHLKGHRYGVFRCNFNPKSNLLVSGSTKGGIFVWDVKTGIPFKALGKDGGMVSSVNFSKDGTLIISSTTAGFWHIWDMASEECLIFLASNNGTPISAVNLTPSEKYILVASYAGVVEFWNFSKSVDQLNLLKVCRTDDDEYISTMTSSSGKTWIVSASRDDRSLNIWNLETEKIEQTLTCHGDMMTCSSCHPTANVIATAAFGSDRTIKIWKSNIE